MSVKRRLRSTTVAAFCLCLGALGMAQQPAPAPAPAPAPDQVTLAFSDPSRAGTLKVDLIQGNITVHGENRKDVSIDAHGRGETARSRQPETSGGLRRLPQTAGFDVTEENNEMKIDAAGQGRALNLDIRVPSRTTLRLASVNGGAIVVDAIDGEIEAKNVNGSITLTNVAGSVVADTVNGKVLVTLTRITSGKAMAFTSLNGAVDVTLPASTKANLKLRSDMGDVFTDFDIVVGPAVAPKVEDTRRNNGRFRLDVNRAIMGTINGGGPEFELRTFNGNVYLRKGK